MARDLFAVETERSHREDLWRALGEEANPDRIAPSRLRELGVYGGAQGIWVDKTRTSQIEGAPQGVTVAVLHTGRSYADDLASDGVISHYPNTGRPPGRDRAEVDATKTAARLDLPVFVVTPGATSASRSVALGWVDGWDDDLGLFLVTFDDGSRTHVRVSEPDEADHRPFHLLEPGGAAGRRRLQSAREGQSRFKFEVIRRYGARCAACGICVPELLDAAHLCAKRDRGSNDPRNGLPLCATHHRAFDAGLFGIEPATVCLVPSPDGPSLEDLGIRHLSLEHLPRRPHAEALAHAWRAFHGAAT